MEHVGTHNYRNTLDQIKSQYRYLYSEKGYTHNLWPFAAFTRYVHAIIILVYR